MTVNLMALRAKAGSWPQASGVQDTPPAYQVVGSVIDDDVIFVRYQLTSGSSAARLA